MTDFYVLVAVKNYLQQNIKDINITLSSSECNKTPFCLVELDGAVSSDDSFSTKVKFRTVCTHNGSGLKNSLEQSGLVNHFLDGSVVELKGGETAIIKLTGSHVDISKDGQNKTVSHFYESLVRG